MIPEDEIIFSIMARVSDVLCCNAVYTQETIENREPELCGQDFLLPLSQNF